MVFEIVMKYLIFLVIFSALASLSIKLVSIIINYAKIKYVKRKKKHGKYIPEDDEIPIETHEQLYERLKEQMLQKQQQKYQEMKKSALQNRLYQQMIEEEEGKIVALAEPQGKWTKLFIDQLREKFLSRRGSSIKSKWTLLVSLYGRSQGKYRGRYK